MSLPFTLSSPFYQKHAEMLCTSYKRLMGDSLLQGTHQPTITDLFVAPIAILSHGTQEDPIFNFASKTTLDIFGYEFEDFILLPSRKSAEMVERAERERLLKEVSKSENLTVYYEAGIQWRDWSGTWGVMTGKGINRQIERAYGVVASRYRVGDQIVLIG